MSQVAKRTLRKNVGLLAKIADAQTALKTADVAVFMKKLELEGYSESTALDDIVSSLKAQGDEAARLVVQRRAEESWQHAGSTAKLASYGRAVLRLVADCGTDASVAWRIAPV